MVPDAVVPGPASADSSHPPRLRVVASLPVRSLRDGKRRLGHRLSSEERRNLIMQLLIHVGSALWASDLVDAIALISGDDEVLGLAGEHGLVPVREAEPGLNAALRTGGAYAAAAGADAHLMVLPDLPLLQAADIQAVLAAIPASAGIVICPDRWGTGTNMLLLRPCDTIQPAFGANSFARHLALARVAGIEVRVVERPGISWDVDTPADLRVLGLQMAVEG